MLVVGLTGGIGSGKSSVAERLVARGAVLVDADAIVRELQEPGGAVLDAMVERFGDGILTHDGHLDRQAVADIVFNDEAARTDLNALVHPLVNAEMARRIGEHAGTDRVVVMDIPLLNERRDGLGHVIVVDTPVDIAVERLVRHRGFSEADARARIAAQISREERRALADFVVDNGGDLAQLDAEVARCWEWLTALEQPTPG
ncbi:dephospho-CoA kinase [Actinomarinicola tropica]|uniref:Dephospho-CoA kinase n=1 Tax=Actinomarinicola tropica TaxID=2789776 RepID=A0A5Q2RKM7_9ACTN|nr:dephospho-CoA kinase [Actinomarinicola tropica]QGG95472.1 dephospho-CoA kinase [Actinomarinicola tropica]